MIRSTTIFIKIDQENEIQNIDEQQAKKSKENIPRLLDGKYFTIVKSEGTRIEAACNLCGKLRKGDQRSTGNFFDHFKTSHPSLVKEVDEYRNKKKQIVQTTPMIQTTLREKMPFFRHKWYVLCLLLTFNQLNQSFQTFLFFFVPNSYSP